MATRLSATKNDAIEHFGSDYVITRYAFDECLGDEESGPMYESLTGPLTYVEYRKRGIAISIDADDRVNQVSFVKGSIGAAFSQCDKVTSANAVTKNHPKTIETGVSPTPYIRQWIAPTYLGLKLGESTGDDVRRLFGKPIDEYPNRDEDKVFDKDAENEIVLDYKKPDGANGSVVAILGKKTRIVKAISIYPADKITMQEAISKFGPGFFQKGYLPICIKEDEKPGILDESMSIPFILVYPNLGLSVDIRKHDDDFTVGRIDYLMKCE